MNTLGNVMIHQDLILATKKKKKILIFLPLNKKYLLLIFHSIISIPYVLQPQTDT